MKKRSKLKSWSETFFYNSSIMYLRSQTAVLSFDYYAKYSV